mgnify:CR=1 FL=1|tara:strand:- start:4038 stop:4814 length:777 start_codon:yes stop_codon:yes gene_type:complete
MGKMFGNLTSTENLEATEDRVGGGFEAVPSDVYDGTIVLAYVKDSARSSSKAVVFHIDIGGKEVRDEIWFLTGAGDNFYVDKNDATKRHPLPGFTTVDDICLLTTGDGLSEQDVEEKIVKIYNTTEKKEVPTPAPCLVGLHGQKIKLGILRNVVDKNRKAPDGSYQPTGETRTENEIDKVFHAETGRTVNEYRHEVETAEFMTAWLAKNKNEDRNKAKGVAGGAPAAGGAGTGRPGGLGGNAGAAGAGSPTKSLFNKK